MVDIVSSSLSVGENVAVRDPERECMDCVAEISCDSLAVTVTVVFSERDAVDESDTVCE